MEQLQNVLELVRPGVYMTSIDLKDAFYSAAGTRHFQDILGLSWNFLVSIRQFRDIYKTSSCR